jgi:hypothetical protein
VTVATITPATLRLREAALPYERHLQRYVCPIYGVGKTGAYSIGSGFLLRLSSATLLVTAGHVLHKIGEFQLQMPAGSRIVPIEGEPHAHRVRLQGPTPDYGYDVAFVLLHIDEMLSPPSTPALTPTDLDLADIPAPQTAYGFIGIPGSENQEQNGIFDGKSYFYGGLPAERDRYQLLQYHSATHFIMKFDHLRMLDEDGTDIQVPDAHGMSGGPVFRIGGFEDIRSAAAKPRLIAITTEWWPQFNVLVGVRIGVVIDAIRQLLPQFASELPAPVHFEGVIK